MNFSWLLPYIKGIPVLMYHNVIPGINDALTIDPGKLREQWALLKNEGYKCLSLFEYLEIIKNGVLPVQKCVLLTFDDGYRNNYEYVYPLLKEMGWMATFFIIADSLTPHPSQNYDTPQPKMSLKELKELDPSIVQLAMHGYSHEHFDHLSLSEITQVLEKSSECFDQSGLTYYKILAYPYGARPKDQNINKAMKQWMAANGIVAAFRIGNQPCKIPVGDQYELKRIDIKGTDTLQEFKIKLQKGKLKPL